MKSKIGGIVALVGAALVAVYAIIAFIQVLPVISYLFQAPLALIALIILVAAAVIGVVGAIRALTKKDLASVILRGVAAVLLIIFGALSLFEILMILGLVVLAASIAVDYLVK